MGRLRVSGSLARNQRPLWKSCSVCFWSVDGEVTSAILMSPLGAVRSTTNKLVHTTCIDPGDEVGGAA